MAIYTVEVNAVFKTYVSVDATDLDSARWAAYHLANRQIHTGYNFTHYVDRTTWPVSENK